MRNILYICFLSFFLFGWGVQGQAKKKNKEKKETLTAYQKLFKGKQVKTARGLMTVHKIGDKVLVEFPIRLLGKDMMLTSSCRIWLTVLFYPFGFDLAGPDIPDR